MSNQKWTAYFPSHYKTSEKRRYFVVLTLFYQTIYSCCLITRFYVLVKLAYTLAIFFTYFIQFYVPMEILLPPLKKGLAKGCTTGIDIFMRTAMVTVTCKLDSVEQYNLG